MIYHCASDYIIMLQQLRDLYVADVDISSCLKQQNKPQCRVWLHHYHYLVCIVYALISLLFREIKIYQHKIKTTRFWSLIVMLLASAVKKMHWYHSWIDIYIHPFKINAIYDIIVTEPCAVQKYQAKHMKLVTAQSVYNLGYNTNL